MKIDEFSDKWSGVEPSHSSYQRVDAEHILDVYMGKNTDNQKEFLILSANEPAKFTSSKSIDIQRHQREDGSWSIIFRLIDKEEDEVFTHLCWDLIERARLGTTAQIALEILVIRFLKWQKLMLNWSDLMSEEVIKGLIGELLYAKEFLSKEFSWDEIISAWLGPDGRDKDFVFENSWSEVKCLRPGKSTVQISSLEQLNSEVDGILAVMYLDKTSNTDSQGFSFAVFINEIRELLKASPAAATRFEAKLFELNYVERKEYYEKYYAFQGGRLFTVTEGFPRFSTAPQGIVRVRYDISIADLSEFEREV